VLVAGDLFDSPSADRATVAAAMSAVGQVGLPVYAIPGNHDHGGPGSLWEQEFFRRERENLAPNLTILLRAEPMELASAVLFPCPLLRRREPGDPTAWLRFADPASLARFGAKPRVVLAHGSVTNFATPPDEDDPDQGAANLLDLSRLPGGDYDYVALGDWHGTRQVGQSAWYPGTPEPDRFPRGGDHEPGNVLVVDAGRGVQPRVKRVRTGTVGWHQLSHRFHDDTGLGTLEGAVDGLVGTRADRDLLRLTLEGSLGIGAAGELGRRLESWRARLLDLRLEDRSATAPTPEELEGLTRRTDAPLVARVAALLAAEAAGSDPAQAEVARTALLELHLALTRG
jgi:DNA repair exonuclease SbcCD nuclease subunit